LDPIRWCRRVGKLVTVVWSLSVHAVDSTSVEFGAAPGNH